MRDTRCLDGLNTRCSGKLDRKQQKSRDQLVRAPAMRLAQPLKEIAESDAVQKQPIKLDRIKKCRFRTALIAGKLQILFVFFIFHGITSVWIFLHQLQHFLPCGHRGDCAALLHTAGRNRVAPVCAICSFFKRELIGSFVLREHAV